VRRTFTSGSSCLTSTNSGASSEHGTTAALAVLAAPRACPLAARLPPAAARFLAGAFGAFSVCSGVSGPLPAAPSVAGAASAAAAARAAVAFFGLPRCRFFGGKTAGIAGMPSVWDSAPVLQHVAVNVEFGHRSQG